MGLPVIVVETQHMKAARGAMRSKTDRNDVQGVAQTVRMGWLRSVHVKSAERMQLCMLLAKGGGMVPHGADSGDH